MSFAKTALLGVLVGTGVTWAAPQANAQAQWQGSSPVFQGDVEQRQRQLEEQRAERRKAYSVSYPKFMDGGEKPVIAPEKPSHDVAIGLRESLSWYVSRLDRSPAAFT